MCKRRNKGIGLYSEYVEAEQRKNAKTNTKDKIKAKQWQYTS